MATVCSICASTEGPFTQETTGVTSSPYFTKCQSCDLNLPAISFDGTVGQSPSRSSFEKYFYECPHCGMLFYGAIPYAFTHFGVMECSNCHHPFPAGEDIEFPESSKADQMVLSNSWGPKSLEELEPLYEKLVAQQPKLSKAIANVMLVKTPKRHDIWVVCQGSDPAIERALRPLLMAFVDKKLSFSSGKLWKFSREEEGVTIIRQIEESYVMVEEVESEETAIIEPEPLPEGEPAPEEISLEPKTVSASHSASAKTDVMVEETELEKKPMAKQTAIVEPEPHPDEKQTPEREEKLKAESEPAIETDGEILPVEEPPAEAVSLQKPAPEPIHCPNCKGERFTHKPKLVYKQTGKPANRFIDLFGGIFMGLTGVGILWVVFANWKTSPSLYLLAMGFLFLSGGSQAVKYLRNEKVRIYQCKCRDCGHLWQLSEAETVQLESEYNADTKTGASGSRKWIWWLVLVFVILSILCVGMPLVIGFIKSAGGPEKVAGPSVSLTSTAVQIAEKSTSTATKTLPTSTVEQPTNTIQPSDTLRPTDTHHPTHTFTPQPTRTQKPTTTPRPTDTATTVATQPQERIVRDQVIPVGLSVNSLAISPIDPILVVGGDDKDTQVWGLEDGYRFSLVGHEEVVLNVTFSPDGDLVATGSDDATVRLWDVSTGNLLKTLSGHHLWVNSVAFSPDGTLLGSGSADGTVILWDTDTGQINHTLEGPVDWVRSIAFSPNGDLIAAGTCAELETGSNIDCAVGEIWLWNTTTGQVEVQLLDDGGWVTALAFSPNGQILAAGSDNGKIRLWNLGTEQVATTLEGHAIDVNSVVYSPGGGLLASGSYDGQILIWNPETGELLQTLEHTAWSSVNSLVFSPDGKTLISGSEDETVVLWHIQQP